jgi:hypothetical protein
MDGKEIYPYLKKKNYYFFNCESKTGEILKCARFDKITSNGFFNLALVDLTKENEWSDKNRTAHKNGDMVLRTVVSIIEDFLNKNPKSTISIKSNTPSKQRLYNQVITSNLHRFSSNYQILGVLANKMEQFKKNSLYDSFLIKKIN